MNNKQLQQEMEAALAKLKQLPDDLPVYNLVGYQYEITNSLDFYYVDEDYESTETMEDVRGIVI